MVESLRLGESVVTAEGLYDVLELSAASGYCRCTCLSAQPLTPNLPRRYQVGAFFNKSRYELALSNCSL